MEKREFHYKGVQVIVEKPIGDNKHIQDALQKFYRQSQIKEKTNEKKEI